MIRDRLPAIPSIRRNLLGWYRRHARALPWRPTRGTRPDPYHVIVSEAMLQQTQVATVVDYFRRFVARWPDVRALASADEGEVLRQWQGLGYYRRARHLHAAAVRIVTEHDGRVPDDVDELLRLPGVGRYTAGAVASIAYDRPRPILDGNVARVLARWLDLDQPIDARETQSQLWSVAEQIVAPQGARSRSAGTINQALMELGALVCTPRQPHCLACPVRAHCEGYAQGRAERLPVKRRRPAVKQVRHHVLAVARRDRFLFEKRPEDGLWSSMWQLPTLGGAARGAAGVRRWFEQHSGLVIEAPRRVATYAHRTTHRDIEFCLWSAPATAGRLRPGRGVWRRLDRIDDLPLSNPQRRAIDLVSDGG